MSDAGYPRYGLETITKLWRWAAIYIGLRRIYVRCRRDPQRHQYMDAAMDCDAGVAPLVRGRSGTAGGRGAEQPSL